MITNSSEVTQMTKFMMQNKLFNPTGMHPNSSMYAIPPYFYGIDSPSEFNTSFFHELYLNGNFTYYYIPCPSMQMPAGNVIAMIMYALVFIVGLFGNTLVIYAVLRFSKMQTVTNIYILNLGKLTRALFTFMLIYWTNWFLPLQPLPISAIWLVYRFW